MRKYINSKVYDTNSAELIASWDNGYSFTDFSYCSEDLYRKKTGEFFIFGEGGANSIYSKRYGTNEWGSGSKITPITVGEAREWLEEHADADTYDSVFGPIEEDESKVVAAYYIRRDAVERLSRAAKQRGISAGDIVAELVLEHLAAE